jgi:O-methyltransferase
VPAKSSILDPAIQEYIVASTVRETEIQRELRLETSRLSRWQMAIGPEQGALMALLARATGARRYLEIGVFTGYSSLSMALALPPDGYVLACDIDDVTTATARRFWELAGVAGKIDLRIGPAAETLERLRNEKVEPFDMAFIDADKARVETYYELALDLLRPGGLVLIDNVLWDGAVLDETDADAQTVALRAVTRRAARDERVEAVLLPVCDGILIARKRP